MPATSEEGAQRSASMSRAVVLSAALDIIDRDGVDRLTMRRLGHALGRDPMALYRHAANKNALLDGVVELVMEQIHVDPTDPDWSGQLRRYARGFRSIALAHPHVVPLLVTRPLATPLSRRPLGTLRPLEDTLELLMRAGFSNVEALHVYRSLQGLLFGHILNELQELVEHPEETDHLLRLGLHRLSVKEFPALRGLASALLSYDGAAELERGLDILIDDLQDKTPHRPGTPSDRS